MRFNFVVKVDEDEGVDEDGSEELDVARFRVSVEDSGDFAIGMI